MAGKKKGTPAKQMKEFSVYDFCQAIEHYRRDQVLLMMKKGVLGKIEDQDKNSVYRQLLLLRDKKILDYMAKETGVFPIEMLDVDYANMNNRGIVSFVLTKYPRKFDQDNKAVCDRLFEVACIVENKDMILSLIMKKKAVDKYSKLVTGSGELLKLIEKIKPEMLTEDLIVRFFVEAALADHCVERITNLVDRGFDVNTKNSDGLTACDVLEEKIRSTRYSKNKSGDLKKKQDQRSIKYLEKISKGTQEDESAVLKKKKIMAILIPVIAIAVIIGAVGIHSLKISDADSENSSDFSAEAEEVSDHTNDAQEETADDIVDESAGYSTDTSIAIEDGNTVNIDYIGYVDGEAFEGGDTQGRGTDLTIGSGSYIDTFEEQLIGHYVGETVEVTVTFPEDYGVEELNGKEAVFDVTINGVYR